MEGARAFFLSSSRRFAWTFCFAGDLTPRTSMRAFFLGGEGSSEELAEAVSSGLLISRTWGWNSLEIIRK